MPIFGGGGGLPEGFGVVFGAERQPKLAPRDLPAPSVWWYTGAMKRPMCLLAVLGLFLTGCYNWNSAVRGQASFDHDCPEAQVRVLRDNGDGMARAVWLDVCGQRRIYRDIGGTTGYLWQDMTEVQTSGGDTGPVE